MSAILNSFFLVLASEMGDKTQLLALVLASRYRRPWLVMLGILIATLVNHGLASWVGGWLALQVSPEVLRYGLAFLFVAFALWILIPDKESEFKPTGHLSALATTIVVFFIAEMGDKTQLATIALGAEYKSPLLVTIGTTLGMLVADGLAVFFGDRLTAKLPLNLIRKIACVLFILFAIGVLFRPQGS